MGNEPSPNQNEKNNSQKTIENNNNISSELNNQLDIKKDKKEKVDPKSILNTLMTNIQHNSEYDETEELDLNYLDEYVDSIFPKNFPKDYVELIRSEICEIKNVKIGGQNNIKNIFQLKQINNQNCFYFICSMKKITENTANIAYKFKIIDVSIQKIGIKADEIIEKEENKSIIENLINEEYQKLNEKV